MKTCPEKKMLVTYLINTWNRKEVVMRHLDMVTQQTYQGPLEVIVCVDGSTDGTQEMLEALSDCYQFPMRWFDTGSITQNTAAKSRNNGIRAAKGKIIIMLDDDCLPHPQLIESFVNNFKPLEIQLGYKTVSEHYLKLPLPVPIEPGNPTTWWNSWLTGNFCYFQTGNCCMSIDAARNRAKDGSYGFDERFISYGHEDSELGRRLHGFGYKLVFNRDAVAWHMNRGTCPQQDMTVKEQEKQDTAALLHEIIREPVSKAYTGNRIAGWMHTPELQWLYEQASKMMSVVEVGCWQGRSTHALLSGCRGPVVAVDKWDVELMQPYGDARVARHAFFNHVKGFLNLTVMEMDSFKAAEAFESKSVDMVFIDADHRYEAVKADILAWLPKAKKLIGGHDYSAGWPGVNQAVQEIFGDTFRVFENIWYVEL
jgi:glycosyltransferase involved in cell wall biosynthesis